MHDMFEGVTLSTEKYDALLTGWNALPSLQWTFLFTEEAVSIAMKVQELYWSIPIIGT